MDLWLLQQEEKNSEAREGGREHVMPGVNQAEPMTFQLVPAAIIKVVSEQAGQPQQTAPYCPIRPAQFGVDAASVI